MGKKDKIVIEPPAFIKIRVKSASHDVVIKTKDGKEKVVYRPGG